MQRKNMTNFKVEDRISELAKESQLAKSTIHNMYRVLNGNKACIKDFPFAVFIYISKEDDGHACAGSLISPNFVITAAHCLFDIGGMEVDCENIHISAGTEKSIRESDNIYNAEKIYVHPKYNPNTSLSDLALIKLDENIPESIAVPTKIYDHNVTDEMHVKAAGWGLTSNSFTATISDNLNWVNLTISSSDNCKQLNPTWEDNNNYNICTTNKNGSDTCYGDSGGPLVLACSELMPIVGVTSMGNAPGNNPHPLCGQENGVGYYTNLKYHIDWIANQTKIPLSDLLYSFKMNEKALSSFETGRSGTIAKSDSTTISKNYKKLIGNLKAFICIHLLIFLPLTIF
ncbi:hypothetical protein BB561_004547 [Smittium simulii]|uniref:Peptidase S1 domain-containing protein n=1 Tax=Smittium simulii TaxID=133385 RepID=A0A2T9YFM9_9FUNG|nr:hypothetical protein BB561_004547 [Smittium simulii]